MVLQKQRRQLSSAHFQYLYLRFKSEHSTPHLFVPELEFEAGTEVRHNGAAVLLDALKTGHVLVLMQYLTRLGVVPTIHRARYLHTIPRVHVLILAKYFTHLGVVPTIHRDIRKVLGYKYL